MFAHLVLSPGLDGFNHFSALEAQLDDLMHNLLIYHGCAGNSVSLHDCQVARQVVREPGMLPVQTTACSGGYKVQQHVQHDMLVRRRFKAEASLEGMFHG